MTNRQIETPHLPEAEALYRRALKSLPGGNSRTTLFVTPHPPYAASGQGFLLTDVDGHELIDLQNNYTALIHGHAHPEVTAAAREAIEQGASFGLPTVHEINLAAELTARTPWASHWRFANSGSEAVMMALRAARAHTGRDYVLRFDRCYHGSYDVVTSPGSPGVPEAVDRLSFHSEPGNLEAALEIIEREGERLACVLVDAMPNRAGLNPVSQEFMEGIRKATRERGILMLQDEVLTYRIARGGLHSTYGVEPDLVTLGKVIGGGFPVGAIGGREEVMAVFDPRGENPVSHGGTFSANPVTMRAGLAALKLYDEAAIERLNGLGDTLRAGLAEQGWKVTGRGSLVRIHPRDITAEWWRAYEAGALPAANGLISLSTPMDEGTVTSVLEKFGEYRG